MAFPGFCVMCRLSSIDVPSVLLGDDQRIADLHERAATEQGAGGTDRVDLVQLLGVAHHAGHDVVMPAALMASSSKERMG